MRNPDCVLLGGGIWRFSESAEFGQKWVQIVNNVVTVSYAVSMDIFTDEPEPIRQAVEAMGIKFHCDLSNWLQGEWIESQGVSCSLTCTSAEAAQALVSAVLSVYDR